MVEGKGEYNETDHTFTLHLKQSCPPTPNQPYKEDFYIPIRIALFNDKGQQLSLKLKGDNTTSTTEKVIVLKSAEESF
ncbi:DUF3458 domain-containing protein, partial [Vibrio parahaemolyticus]|nr:DUF3458 domain-containing protein [Vibrio parahaemolyticus]